MSHRDLIVVDDEGNLTTNRAYYADPAKMTETPAVFPTQVNRERTSKRVSHADLTGNSRSFHYSSAIGFVDAIPMGSDKDMNLFMVVVRDEAGELWGFDDGWAEIASVGYYQEWGEPEGGIEVYPVEECVVPSYRRIS